MEDEQRQIAAALGRVPSGLYVLTLRRGAVETGMLASWVQQCAFAPPHVSVALKRARPIVQWLTPGSRFTLNILERTQTDMVAYFGRGFDLDEPAFEGLRISHPDVGAPVLDEALAYLHCEVSHQCSVGDHDVLLCEVIGGRVLHDGQPMIHVRKSGLHY
jgi:flavin reductase (DIM6/NTAB) family NADH-FMN oxidoreductase RutF